MKKKPFLILLVSLYFVSTAAVFGMQSALNSTPTQSSVGDNATAEDDATMLGSLLEISPSEPKDQACPLNGQLYTQTERTAWETRRPLAVMVENSQDARPQSGLSRADLVYEAVAEGGITRFMPIFLCAAQIEDVTIAPVRSARTYFVDWASGYNRPMYVHVGGANTPGPADALGQISQYGWNQQNDINQFSVGYPTFIRNESRLDRPVATEHTMETTTEKLWAVAEKRGWTNITPERKVAGKVIPAADWQENFTQWQFGDTPTTSATPATDISYEFWSGYNAFAVKWTYDPTTKLYKRVMGGEPHIDLNNDEQIVSKTVVVLQTDEKGPVDELKHMLYRTTGTGSAIIFSEGNAIKATWKKADRESQLMFTDAAGKTFQFARGPVWISAVDKSVAVNY